MISNWQASIIQAIRKSKASILGHQDIANQAQAEAGVALIECFDNPHAIIYFEASSYDGIEQPGDILIAHPELGVLVIEVKGYSIDFIRRIEGNQLLVQYSNQRFESRVNPLKQASTVMYRVKSRTEKELDFQGIKSSPLFNYVAAFPHIKTSEWRDRGYENSYPSQLLLFREHFLRPERLRERLLRLIAKKSETVNQAALRPEHLEAVKRAIGDSDAVNRARPPRSMIDSKLLGGRIDELLSIEKHISQEQQTLSCLPVEGYPRLIRGVAGSGKTIVLTKMLARYLVRELSKPKDMFSPETESLRVALICFNRTLVPMLRERIKNDYLKIAHEELKDDEILLVSHLNGLMLRHSYQEGKSASPEQVIPYISISGDMKDSDLRAAKYREYLAETPLSYYDAIFVDEAQDLSPTEFQLLADITKTNPNTGEKNLIVFYDDAQNLYGRTRPVWKDLGIDVSRGQRARIMKTCYRNTQEIVELGYNVLLGMQAPQEMRVQTRQYTDINYLLQQDLVEDLGDHIRVLFTKRNFRKPAIRLFDNRLEELNYLIQGLRHLILVERVRPEDILILFPSAKDYSKLSDNIAEALPDAKIEGFVKTYESGEKDGLILRPNHLTLSTIHAAKGYDAQVVILLGADLMKTDAKDRAMFYVAVTRAIMELYIVGIKTDKPNLIDEALLVNEMI